MSRFGFLSLSLSKTHTSNEGKTSKERRHNFENAQILLDLRNTTALFDLTVVTFSALF